MLRFPRPVFPATCLLCAQSVQRAYSLCHQCESALPYSGHCCLRCGEERPGLSLFQGRCGRCHQQPPNFHACVPVFRYEAPVDRLITAFKYHGCFAAGFALGSVMADRLQHLLAGSKSPQLLLPVPLHRRRLRQRGFNQSWQLCHLLSHRLGIPARRNGLVKIRNTKPQSELSAAARRRRNLRGAFALDSSCDWHNVNHIALIDDVVTTMSTANELGRTLESHGIRRVEVWCLARAKR